MRIKRATTYALDCPECGNRMYSVYASGENGEWRCGECRYIFTEKDGGLLPWKKVRINAVQCPDCGRWVDMNRENMDMFNRFPSILCPSCLGEYLAVKFKRRWVEPTKLIKSSTKMGLMDAKDRQDEWVIIYMKGLANNREELYSHFLTPEPKTCKVLWMDGRAVGYYARNRAQDGVLTFRQIYVIPEYRRRGLGSMMWMDFVAECRGAKMYIETPNSTMGRLLKKLGYIDGRGYYTRELMGLSSGM